MSAGAVIISTGASAKWLGLADENRLNGQGVSACAVCDDFFKGQDVAVVGARYGSRGSFLSFQVGEQGIYDCEKK